LGPGLWPRCSSPIEKVESLAPKQPSAEAGFAVEREVAFLGREADRVVMA
jgi:hypothetical protein